MRARRKVAKKRSVQSPRSAGNHGRSIHLSIDEEDGEELSSERSDSNVVQNQESDRDDDSYDSSVVGDDALTKCVDGALATNHRQPATLELRGSSAGDKKGSSGDSGGGDSGEKDVDNGGSSGDVDNGGGGGGGNGSNADDCNRSRNDAATETALEAQLRRALLAGEGSAAEELANDLEVFRARGAVAAAVAAAAEEEVAVEETAQHLELQIRKALSVI